MPGAWTGAEAPGARMWKCPIPPLQNLLPPQTNSLGLFGANNHSSGPLQGHSEGAFNKHQHHRRCSSKQHPARGLGVSCGWEILALGRNIYLRLGMVGRRFSLKTFQLVPSIPAGLCQSPLPVGCSWLPGSRWKPLAALQPLLTGQHPSPAPISTQAFGMDAEEHSVIMQQVMELEVQCAQSAAGVVLGVAVPLSPCHWDLGCPGVVTAWVAAGGKVQLQPHRSLQG